MNKLASGASGSTIKFLTKGMIDSLEMFVPVETIVARFNQYVESIQSEKERIQSQIRLLTEARDRLLPKLMSGEIAV
jgi:type I restriction enzyme S subunit